MNRTPWTVALLFVSAMAGDAASAENDPFLEWHSEPASLTALPPSAGTRLARAELDDLAQGKPTTPFADLAVGIRAGDGRLWVGSARGLMLLEPGAGRWRLFQSRRWLPSDDIRDLAIGPGGEVLVQTAGGFARIGQREATLGAKMAAIGAALERYHVRDGFIASTQLAEPGNADSGRPQPTNDNDGLWTSLYVAAEAFRFAATGSAEAKRNARRSLDALLFLERVTGISGFVARSVVPIEVNAPAHRGEWHRSADDRWWWKGDTSSDELDGHYFAYAVYYNLAADDAEKAELRAVVGRITDHILDHGLHYVGPTGEPTRWGVWAPEKLNRDLRRHGDRGLNSLEILSHLKVAEHIVGKPRYAAMAADLVETHGYLANTVDQKRIWPPSLVNHSDDELAFLAYYPLLLLERDSHRREVYLASLKRSWLIERPEHSPFFNLIWGAALQASQWPDPMRRPDRAGVDPDDYDREICLEWFREVPQDTTSWAIDNSLRRDVVIAGRNRFRTPRGETVLPVAERPVMRWNGDPYALRGGDDGRERDDGTAILLPYWLGRYHRLID